jgi:hypothetical protein
MTFLFSYIEIIVSNLRNGTVHKLHLNAMEILDKEFLETTIFVIFDHGNLNLSCSSVTAIKSKIFRDI